MGSYIKSMTTPLVPFPSFRLSDLFFSFFGREERGFKAWCKEYLLSEREQDMGSIAPVYGYMVTEP
jgi:hypothetical protein